jgi:hypothetical protein
MCEPVAEEAQPVCRGVASSSSDAEKPVTIATFGLTAWRSFSFLFEDGNSRQPIISPRADRQGKSQRADAAARRHFDGLAVGQATHSGGGQWPQVSHTFGRAFE